MAATKFRATWVFQNVLRRKSLQQQNRFISKSGCISTRFSNGSYFHPQELVDDSSDVICDKAIAKEVKKKINEQIEQRRHGRLFAVVHLQDQQYKVTADDIVIVKGEFVPKLGEKLHLDKVLLVGGADFTLVGKPLLDKGLVKVDATVIEKTLTRVIMQATRLRRRHKLGFENHPLSMLRINSIEITKPFDEDAS